MSETANVAPEWGWWDRLLKTGERPELHDGEVKFGYYRRGVGKKEVGARWQAIGIFPGKEPGSVIAEKDGKPTTDRPFDLIFTRSLQAISYELYMGVTRQNAPWPDAPPQAEPTPDTRTFDVAGFKNDSAPPSAPAADRQVAFTDNQPLDPLMEHWAQLSEERRVVDAHLKKPVTTQAEADATSELANRIAKLGKWFGDLYEEKNRPLLDQQKTLRTDYLHPSQEAAGLAQQLTQHQATFLIAEKRRLEAERAAAERRAAEELRQASEKAAETGQPLQPEQVAAAVEPLRAPAKKAGSGGLTGRRTSVTEEPTGIVEDYVAFATSLIRGSLAETPPNVCSNAELKKLLDAKAKAIASVIPEGMTVPGVKFDKQPKVRR